jgi:tetratricopeptide (TPR) repeat protein
LTRWFRGFLVFLRVFLPRRLGVLKTIRSPRVVLWLGAGLLLTGLGAALAGRLWVARALPAAQRALDRHDLTAARAYLDRYLAHWPRDQALLLAARVARLSDACADAERFLTAFEDAFGPTSDSRLEWALLGAQQGDFQGLEVHLHSRAARSPSDSSEILEALARGYLVAQRWPQALAVLDRLIERSPDHVRALLYRGTTLQRLRQTEAAEEDCRRVVALDPPDPADRVALGELLNGLGHTQQARACYQAALASRPADRTALLGLARACCDAFEVDEAQRCLDGLLRADPDCTDGLVERGRLALRRNRAAEAEPFLARVVRAAPSHREAHQLYLLALKELGRKTAASQCEARLGELLREDADAGRLKARIGAADSANVRWELWRWSQRNGQGDQGIPWLLAVLAVAPEHARAHAALAEYFERASQPRRAALHRAAAGKARAGSVEEVRQ